ncbi:MAG: Rieske (2Fe-2S) protein [Ktedonobacteraceae bacterium]|nr:Rieske (2Fe-2S) protein [Ktedonobacteraceae bacterium]
MAGEDQERFEDYLELERYIEELQAGHAAHPPANLTPERARIYRMAALFRSASPEASEPRPGFVASLHERLLDKNDEINFIDPEDTLPRLPAVTPPEQPSTGQTLQKEQEAQPPIIDQPDRKPQKARFFSRRSLLGNGAVAAASLVIGSGIGATLEKGNSNEAARKGTPTPTPTSYPISQIVPSEVAVPHFVANLAELGDRAVRFTTDTLIGYVILSDGDDSDIPKGEVVAMSASCTHMGCIVQWKDEDRSFHCPCHGGLFTEYGKPDKASPLRYLTALPRLQTLVKDGKVYVMVPRGTSKGTSV